jgi:hypothetical protein
VTRAEWHCSRNEPAETDCKIADCGHDFSEAGVITYCQGQDYDSVTYQVGDEVWGMKAEKGTTNCSTVLENSGKLIIGDSQDTLCAKNTCPRKTTRSTEVTMTPDIFEVRGTSQLPSRRMVRSSDLAELLHPPLFPSNGL